MKRTKLIAALTTTLMAAIAINGAASAAPPPTQTVEGSVAIMAKFTDLASCYSGLHRRSAIVTQEMVNGIVGYHFDVDKKTWNKKFKLEPTAGEGDVDLDLFLYSHVPPVTEWPDDPQNAGFPVSQDFNTREPGGEAGIVPKGTTYAIVCMYAGPTHYGFNADFTYTAG